MTDPAGFKTSPSPTFNFTTNKIQRISSTLLIISRAASPTKPRDHIACRCRCCPDHLSFQPTSTGAQSKQLSLALCRLSFVVCRLSFVVCRLSFVVCRSSFVVRRLSFVVRRSSFVVRRLSFGLRIETVGLLAVGSFCRTNLTLTESRKRQRWIEQTNAFTLYPVVRCSTRTTQLARVIPTELPRPIPHKTTFPECRSSACIYNMECSPECR